MDRIRQIQEMQRAAEAGPVQQQAPAAPAVPVQAAVPTPATSQVNDAFAVQRALAVAGVAEPLKADPKSHAEFGKLQKDVGALFGGGKTDIELQGEPWKIISFLDAAPALFTPKKPMTAYEPLVAKQAIVTKQGLLFEVGLKSKDGSEPVQKKAVLVGQDGKLKGTKLETASDLEKLFALPGFLPSNAPKGAKPRESTLARFEVALSKSETLYFNNWGLKVPPSSNRTIHDFTASYHLDEFDAAI